MIVEIGIKLTKSFKYYDTLLKSKGFVDDFQVTTHDLYYTNTSLDGLSENEMKNACIRLRSCNSKTYKIENNLIQNLVADEVLRKDLKKFEKHLIQYGYEKMFDTTKKDFHYYKAGMSSKIQLQQIKNIGLLVYFDNKKYYKYSLETQRRKLIDELNLYGFHFNYDMLGLDKLRTLYYGKEMYSKNQNG